MSVFLMGLFALIALASGQQPAQQPAEAPEAEVTLLKAGLGPCAADFTVNDEQGRPLYNATIHVRVRYGAFGIKRSDLEVGTNSSGKARIEGLPAKAKPLVYEVRKDRKTKVVEQNVSTDCRAAFDVALK